MPLLDLLPVFNAQPGATLLLTPDWMIVGASDDYLAATLTQRGTIVGQYIFDAFPDNPDTPEANAVANVRASLEQVLATQQPHEMPPQHYDVPDPERPGQFVERHWQPRHTPVLDAAGHVQFIIQSVQDITASRLAERQLRQSQVNERAARAETALQRQQLYHVLEQAPAMICIFDGPAHVFQFVNPPYQALVGDRPLVGKPIAEAMPELAEQPIFGLLDGVYQTGETFHAQEMLVQLDHGNEGRQELEKRYYNFIYQARRDRQGAIDGILVFAYEVTEQVLARQQVEQLNQELEARVQERTNALQASLRQTEQQREQLRGEQGRLQQILGQSPAMIATLEGTRHHFAFTNPGYDTLVGHRARLGVSVAECLPEVVEQGFIELLDSVYRTGQAYVGRETPIEIQSAQGPPVIYYLDFTYQPLTDEQGHTTGILAFVVDVTDKVQARRQTERLQAQLLTTAQRQVQEREAFHRVFEQTPALVALLRAPGHRFEYVNPAYQALFPGRQLVGLDAAVAAPELVEQGFVALLGQVYRTGETFYGSETPYTPPTVAGQLSTTHYFNFTYQAYREAGEVAGVSIFAFNVTEQVLARREREAQRQQLQAVFAQAPVAVCVFQGEEFVLDVVNPPMAEMLGRPVAALVGHPFFDVLPELQDQGLPELLTTVRRTGTRFVAQEQRIQLGRHKSGESGYFNFVYEPLLNADQHVEGIVCVATEVTEQVLARQQVQDLNEELAAINEELAATNEELTVSNEELHDSNTQLVRTNVDLDNFIYTASHDLKQPINNIEGLLYALQEELPSSVAQDATIRPVLSRMLDSVERFKRTIEHLTEVSKLQKEHMWLPTSVNLSSVIEDVRLDLLPTIEETNAKVVIDVAVLPPIQFSEKNLRSVVYNLLSNALKYHSPDRLPHVDVRAHVCSGYTVLEVHDNGLGIAPEQLPRLFTMFQRFHDHVEGTGVGLYMVKRMVENAGGRIEVFSQLGAGSTFFVYLPHAEGHAAILGQE